MNPKLSFLTLLVLLNLCTALLAQTINRNIFTTNGPVNATVHKGDTLYIGGSFSQLGYGVRSLVRYFPKGTKPDFTFAQLGRNTGVSAVEPDGKGGYYLAGYIPSYYGVKLENGHSMGVIHILADNSLDPDFIPTDVNDFSVRCMKKQGNRLYIGGHFYTVNGVNHRSLAALNATTGRVMSWFPELDDDIDGIEASDSLVFIHGYFFNIGDHDVNGFAALKASNGKYVRYYSPHSNTITKLKINNNKLYLGGTYSIGYSAHGIAKISPFSAKAYKKFPETNGSISAILPDGKGGYYIGGSFSLIDNTPRTNFAHVLPDGTIDPSFDLYFDGYVSCLETDGISLYIGGNFTRVNNVTRRHAVAVSLQYGKPTPWNPDPDGPVNTMLYSSHVIYMGGSFQHIKGTSRNYAGAVTVTNALTGWAPEADANVKRIISNASGTSLFICGEFTHLKGKSRPYLAKVDNTNGNVSTWNPEPNYTVDDLVLNGSKLFIGGEFQTVHGMFRDYLAEIDTASNNPTDFVAGLNHYVYALTISNGKLYVGGDFFSTQNAYCARFDLNTKKVDSWKPEPNYDVYALAADDKGVVMGGTFSRVNETDKNSIAVIDLATNEITPFNVKANNFLGGAIGAFAFSGKEVFVGGHINYDNANGTGHYSSVIALDTLTGSVTRYFDYSPYFYYYNYWTPVNALTVSDNKLYVGGDFGSLNDSSQNNYIERYNLVSYDLNNNHLTPERYNPNAAVGTLYTDKSQRIIASGGFDLTSYVNRTNLAAINLTTGRALNWHYFPDNEVYAMAIKDSTLFIGGAFTRIIYNSDYSNYKDRNYIAGLSTRTSKPTSWNADANSYVRTLWMGDSILFAGGEFTNIKGVSRNFAAAVGTGGGGTIKTWTPEPNNTVFSILGTGSKIYLGGYFTTVKGLARKYLASVNKINGTPDAWKPNPDDGVLTLAANSTTLYVGGFFKHTSTQKRWSVAAYTIATNALTPFNPELKSNNLYFPAPSLHSLAIYGQTLFMGSDRFNTLDSIKGTARYILGAADTTTGTATPFNPRPDDAINYLSVLKNRLLVGGQYTSLATNPSAAYFSVFDLDPSTQTGDIAKTETAFSDGIASTAIVTKSSKKLSAVLTPNPAKDLAVLNISGNENDVNVTVTDMSGKVLLQLIKQNAQQIHIPVQTFAQGFYLLTISDGKQAVAIKFLKTQ